MRAGDVIFDGRFGAESAGKGAAPVSHEIEHLVIVEVFVKILPRVIIGYGEVIDILNKGPFLVADDVAGLIFEPQAFDSF